MLQIQLLFKHDSSIRTNKAICRLHPNRAYGVAVFKSSLIHNNNALSISIFVETVAVISRI